MSLTQAQEQEQADVFKQSAGDKNLELQFDPGAIFNASNSNNVFSNGLGVRFRLFPSETIAYRLNLNINYTNSTEITQDADDAANIPELKYKESGIGVYLNPGIEKHFLGTKRLSPYIGAEAIFGYKTSTIKSDYQVTTEVHEAKAKNSYNDDGLTVGVAALAGVDFYVAKKLYLGLEINYGLRYFMASTMKLSSNEPNITDQESKVGKANTFSFQPGAMGIFRIGFLF